jgi:diguanylate cyclase (GGDEF)-like protein/PAS domain S-box-containing protein
MEVIVGLLTNIVLLMSLSVVYSLFTNETKLSRFSSKLVMGISVSIVGFIIMSTAVEAEPGVFFDGRSVLMLLSGIFFGIVPVIVGGLSLSFFRITMGGSGVIPGILWVIIPGIIGVVWRYIRIKKESTDLSKINLLEQYLLLFITQVLMVGLLFFFPARVSLEAIAAVALPLALFYPIGGLAVSAFMLKQRINYFSAIEIKDREQEYKDLFNKSASYSFIIDPESGKFFNVNQAAIDKYGYSYEEFTNLSIYDVNLLGREDLDKLRDKKDKENSGYFRVKHILKNKEIMDVEVRSVYLTLEGQVYTYATVTDITDRIQHEAKYQDVNVKLETTLHSVSEGIISTNEYGEIEIINDIAKDYLSVSSKVIGKSITDVVKIYSKDHNLDFGQIFNSTIRNNESFKSDKPYLLINNNNDLNLYVDFSLSPITFDEVIRGSILVFRDVTNQFEQNEQIQFISQHDYLTGLFNRYFLEVEMKRLDTKRQLPISIIHGDVNGLKLTNDAFGHIEGDKLLVEISDILKKATRSEDIIARWGGDEFIILLPQTTEANAKKVLARIRDLQIKSMYEIMKPSISLGLATKTDETQDLSNVLIEAETEMYNNKQTDGKHMRHEFLSNLEKRLYNIHPELGKHAFQVSSTAKEFGEYLKLDEDDLSLLIIFAAYHDIGWINIGEELLLKTDNITEDEREIINSHCEVGFRIMKSIPELSGIAELIIAHHERWDGTGYPFGLKGKTIPYLSRILSIIDAYDMMINNSIYSPFRTIPEALKELDTHKGTQFDPGLVKEFIKLHTNKKK